MDKVVHFEIPFDDSERAIKFYRETFGWEIKKANNMPYWLADTVETDDRMIPKEPGAINGGMMKRDEQNDPGSKQTAIVIKVLDIEEYRKKIEGNNGKMIMETRSVGDFGLYTRFQDTEGNIVSLWQDVKN